MKNFIIKILSHIKIFENHKVLKEKNQIFKWLKNYDRNYKENIKKNAYELINIHDHINQTLFNEMISKDNLPNDYFEKLKLEGHQYIINSKTDIGLSNKKLEIIPVQFYHVVGQFDCSVNQLTSLKGCPQIVGGHFVCYKNQLTSLEYGPQVIKDYFYCQYNHLTSLEYFPEIVTKGVYLYLNTQLLKYKNQSNDPNIPNMSDDEFLDQRNFSFWKQFHLIEKANKENKKILDDLFLDENQANEVSTKKKVKKV